MLFLLVDDWIWARRNFYLFVSGVGEARMLASTWRRTDTTCIHTSLVPLAWERQLKGVSWLLMYLLLGGLEFFTLVFDTAHVNVMTNSIWRVTSQQQSEETRRASNSNSSNAI